MVITCNSEISCNRMGYFIFCNAIQVLFVALSTNLNRKNKYILSGGLSCLTI